MFYYVWDVPEFRNVLKLFYNPTLEYSCAQITSSSLYKEKILSVMLIHSFFVLICSEESWFIHWTELSVQIFNNRIIINSEKIIASWTQTRKVYAIE
jgi:hypothetical protein